MNIIIFGPPGAGKGTQSNFLIQDHGMFQVSTGDLLRNELKKVSELSKQIKSIMDAGKLVSDNIIYSLIEKKLSDKEIKNKIIFDGFPRNLDQVSKLELMLQKHDQKISKVLNLKVDYSILIKRLSGRISCSNCKKTFNEFFDPPPSNCCQKQEFIKRSDDNEETVSKRLKTYDNETLPILEFYKKQNKVVDIDAMKQITEVRKEIRGIIAS
ncbi:MAG: adenylate kinase [Candidatus Pelagibacter sp.]|nr:adenylate kinase [Candidatus Pelagibacter sp.]OUV98420.1 MAG: adenylate kinase [Candidatus Pelagibacter sp. TMED142]